MMLFWVIQLLVDVLIVGLAVSYILQKRRLLRLEGDLHLALMRLNNEDQTQSVNTPLGNTMSTLSERRKETPSASDAATKMSSAGRYALAQKLLTEGHAPSEVARRSGISETELVLLRKIAKSPNAYAGPLT